MRTIYPNLPVASEAARANRQSGSCEWSCIPFPLTPALSLRERENHRQRIGKSDASCMSGRRAAGLPAPEPRLVRGLPTIPPLPFRRGEGRGEGSDLGFRAAKRVQMAGDSLPAASNMLRAGDGSRSVVDGGSHHASFMPLPSSWFRQAPLVGRQDVVALDDDVRVGGRTIHAEHRARRGLRHDLVIGAKAGERAAGDQ